MSEVHNLGTGKLYDANFDQALLKERERAKELCHDYNHLRPSQTAEKAVILRKLLGRIGDNCVIEPSFFCDYGNRIEIGDLFLSNHNLVILDGGGVFFGDNVFIGPNCGFYTAGHPLDAERRIKGLEYALPIRVGNKVWFGGNACVMPGVSIGDGAVIGAGSVVTSDIPAGVLAMGAPCRVIRQITPEDGKRLWAAE